MSARVDVALALVNDAAIPVDELGGRDGDVPLFRSDEMSVAAAQVMVLAEIADQLRLGNITAVMSNATRQMAEGTGDPASFADLYAYLNPIIVEGLGL